MDRAIFPSINFEVDPSLVFVAMPFSGHFDALYEAIEGLVNNHCHLRCLRADTIFENGRITADIWRCVNEAMVTVADLSGRNANVFYEVGLAHALGKPVILLSRDVNDTPFDLRELRVIQYDPEGGFKALRDRLLEAIRSCVTTIPERWDRPRQGVQYTTPKLRISGFQQPKVVSVGQPFEIVIRARNQGDIAREGYFSLSFPEGVDEDDITIVQTDIEHRVGRLREPWCSGRIILTYPIAEAWSAPWQADCEHYMKIRLTSQRRGWLRLYASSSCSDASGQWAFDQVPACPM